MSPRATLGCLLQKAFYEGWLAHELLGDAFTWEECWQDALTKQRLDPNIAAIAQQIMLRFQADPLHFHEDDVRVILEHALKHDPAQ